MTLAVVDRLTAARDQFLAALPDGRGQQARLLDEIVGRNRDTAFGRDHGFTAIHSHADYVRSVPIRDHAGHLPWLERCISGEPRVLTAAPVKMFLSTTGSTGAPKLFPATQAYLSASARNLAAYWGTLVAHEPALLARDAVVGLHLIPRRFTSFSAGGVPVHRLAFMSAQADGALPFTQAPWYPPPAHVEPGNLTYFLLRLSCEYPVAGFICLHSSRLTGLLYTLRKEGPRLVEEVRAGTLFGAPYGPPNPARAAELEALVRADTLTPRYVWPNSLRLVTSWRGATYDLVRDQIHAGYGTPVFPAPCVSTEAGQINMPVDLDADGPLTLQTSYYEFRVPGATDEAPTMTIGNLEEGRVYEMVVTTKSGLYRYCCGNLFRVVGWMHEVPRVEFVARTGTVDLTGEKLSEEQAQTALADVVAGAPVAAATLCATWGTPPYYTALFEPTAPWSAARCAEVAAQMDDFLRRNNSRYKWKRDWNELAPLAVRVVSRGTFARVQQRLARGGAPLPSLKQQPLHGDLTALALHLEMEREPD